MNDEIKEIITRMASYTIHYDCCSEGDAEEDIDKLLDYITNLEQSDTDKQLEIMKLKDRLEKQRKEYQDTYKDVRIEIKEKNNTITNLQQTIKNQAKRNSRQRLANTKQQELILKLQQQINNLNKFIKEYGNYLDSLHLDDKGIVYRAREKWNLLLKGIDDND